MLVHQRRDRRGHGLYRRHDCGSIGDIGDTRQSRFNSLNSVLDTIIGHLGRILYFHIRSKALIIDLESFAQLCAERMAWVIIFGHSGEGGDAVLDLSPLVRKGFARVESVEDAPD